MSWKVIEPTLQNTKLHIAKADCIAWGQAKTEIRGLEKSHCEITKKKTINEVSESDVMNIFFGTDQKSVMLCRIALERQITRKCVNNLWMFGPRKLLRGNVKRSENRGCLIT